MSCSKALSFFICPPVSPIALERGGWSLATRPLPAVASPLPGSAWGPSHLPPLPHGCSKWTTFLGVIQFSEGRPVHCNLVLFPPSCSPGQDWDADELRGQEHRGHRCPPLPATPPFTVVGTETPEAKGQPTVPALPAGQGLPSRPGVTLPTRGLRSAVAVLKFLIALGLGAPSCPSRPAGPEPGHLFLVCVWCAAGVGRSRVFLSLEGSCPLQHTMPSDCMPGST